MSLYGASVETGLHCLVGLVYPPESGAPSTRELADFQGVSPSFVAKLFTKLAKAKLVIAAKSIQGGFRLARAPATISVWDVVAVLEPDRPLFKCREIRQDLVVFDQKPPRWATCGLCPIHSVMREAEKAMRQTLQAVTIADLVNQVANDVPKTFGIQMNTWIAERKMSRRDSRPTPKK